MAPPTSSIVEDDMPAIPSPLVTTDNRTATATAPTREPRPPLSEMPPIKTAVAA